MSRTTSVILIVATLVILAGPLASEDKPGGPSFEQLMAKGDTFLQHRSYEQAAETYRQACVSTGKPVFECEWGQAQAYAKLNRKWPALGLADDALKLTTEPATQARVHNLKGLVYLADSSAEWDSFRDAEREFDNAISLAPKMAEPVFNKGYALLKEGRVQDGVAQLKKSIALEAQNPKAPLARRLIRRPELANLPLAEDFSIHSKQGDTFSLEGLTGKVTILDFWGTFCVPCIQNLPKLRGLREKYADRRVVLISLSEDLEKQKWESFLEKEKMDWPQAWDENMTLFGNYGIMALPEYVVIDQDGVVRRRTGDLEAIMDSVERALNEPSRSSK